MRYFSFFLLFFLTPPLSLAVAVGAVVAAVALDETGHYILRIPLEPVIN